jgi:3-oxoacyl-[acyl-carrier-protein] synthase II
MPEKPQIVVTGLGLVTPLGLSASESWQQIVRGDSGIGPLTLFDTSGHSSHAAAEIKNFELRRPLRLPKNEKFMTKSAVYAVQAVQEAVDSCEADFSQFDPYRIGVYTGSGETGIESSEFFRALTLAWRGVEERDFKKLGGRPSRLIDKYFSLRTLANAGVAFLATELNAHGPNANFVQGDLASAWAISSGLHDLQEDRCDIALVGGYDSLLSVETYLVYQRTGLLSKASPDHAYRPFDRRRDGIVLGEGAGFLVLERRKDAMERGATIRGEITHIDFSMNAAEQMEQSNYQKAVEIASGRNESEEEPDCIMARGIGTSLEDRLEAKAIHSLFGDRLPVTALKSYTGYLGASTTAVETALALLSLQERLVPPIARLADPEPDFNLNFVFPGALAMKKTPLTFLLLSSTWEGQFCALKVRSASNWT